MAGERGRRQYLDWLRGLAVVIMIEAHLLDSWTRAADRDSPEFRGAMLVGGFGAPMFLFLAGVAVALSAGAKARSTGDPLRAARMVARRGLEIFALAFLFRFQAWVLGWGPAWTLLKVDVLNIMGPSIVAAAMLWASARTTRTRALLLGIAALTFALVTPIVAASQRLGPLPDPLEAYLRTIPRLTNFAFFPWTGFVFAGAALGVVLERTRTHDEEAHANVVAGAAGIVLALVGCAAAFVPSAYAGSAFWTTSPAFFTLRAGLLVLATSLACAWVPRTGNGGWSPMQQLGRTSLFIYWIHVELVYGLISLPLHEALPLPQAAAALVAFVGLMLACSVAKDRAVARWRERRRGVLAAAIRP